MILQKRNKTENINKDDEFNNKKITYNKLRTPS